MAVLLSLTLLSIPTDSSLPCFPFWWLLVTVDAIHCRAHSPVVERAHLFGVDWHRAALGSCNICTRHMSPSASSFFYSLHRPVCCGNGLARARSLLPLLLLVAHSAILQPFYYYYWCVRQIAINLRRLKLSPCAHSLRSSRPLHSSGSVVGTS